MAAAPSKWSGSFTLESLDYHVIGESGLLTGRTGRLNGHDPVEDAEVVAELALAAIQQEKCNSLQELLDELGTRTWTMEPDRCESSRGWIARNPGAGFLRLPAGRFYNERYRAFSILILQGGVGPGMGEALGRQVVNHDQQV